MFVVKIKGGLGNQLFQYNFAKYLQKKYPQNKIVFNTSYFKCDSIHGGYMLGEIPFEIKNFRTKNYKTIKDENFDSPIDASENIVFDGYWQNIDFFTEESLTRAEFFKDSLNENNKKWQDQIINTEKSVSIHVRCGDYNNNYLLGNIATKSYFNNAISEVIKTVRTPVFFVFSDNLEWTKDNIDFKGNTVHFITGNEKASDNKWDIFLMSHCKYNILSNSSFSWWSHYFNTNDDKKAYIPEYWINDIADGYPSIFSSLQTLPSENKISNIPESSKAKKNPEFSIIVTAYNQENCIRRAVSSVLNQTFQDFELILVDDCSTDKTAEVLAEYQKKNKQVKVIRHKNNTSSHAARKTGVENAEGKYIIFLDGDDYLFIDALEKLNEEVVQKKDFDVCEFSYVTRPDNKVFLPQEWNQELPRIKYYYSNSAAVTVWNKLYEKEMLKKAFSAMENAYIRTADDTYESTCISYFTQKYIQTDVKVINYLFTNGISLKLNNYESNLIHAKSISTAIECLRAFFQKNAAEDFSELCNITERRCFNWLLTTIKDNTVEEDVVRSLALLPQYFSFEFVEPYVTKLYMPYFKKKQTKKMIKRIIPPGIKTLIKKVLK